MDEFLRAHYSKHFGGLLPLCVRNCFQREVSYGKIFATSQEISLSGARGSGKSTLLKHLAYLWSQNRLWNDSIVLLLSNEHRDEESLLLRHYSTFKQQQMALRVIYLVDADSVIKDPLNGARVLRVVKKRDPYAFQMQPLSPALIVSFVERFFGLGKRYQQCMTLLLCLKRRYPSLYVYLVLRRQIAEPLYWTESTTSDRVLQYLKSKFFSGMSSNPLMLRMMCEKLQEAEEEKTQFPKKTEFVSSLVDEWNGGKVDRLKLQKMAWNHFGNSFIEESNRFSEIFLFALQISLTLLSKLYIQREVLVSQNARVSRC